MNKYKINSQNNHRDENTQKQLIPIHTKTHTSSQRKQHSYTEKGKNTHETIDTIACTHKITYIRTQTSTNISRYIYTEKQGYI